MVLSACRYIRRIISRATTMSSWTSGSNSNKSQSVCKIGRTNFQKCFALCCILTFLFIVAYLLTNDSEGPPKAPNTRKNYAEKTPFNRFPIQVASYDSDKYQLNLDHCKIPKVPLEENMSWQRMRRKWSHTPCRKGITSLDENGNLVFDRPIEGCCYQTITRPDNIAQDTLKVSEDCIPLESSKPNEIKAEYFQVQCPSQRPEYHATTQFNSKIQEKMKYWEFKVPSEKDRPPSILMIAIDATSRTGLYRSLPKTARLLDQMQFVDFKGHHILGEPTLPNAIPILFGTSAEEFWKVDKTEWRTPWDDYPFIWKEFDKLNYITQFMEDEQAYGTFNYGGQTGFRRLPTDIYPRPLLLAQGLNSRPNQVQKNCFGNRTLPEFLLNYVKRFLTKTRGIPSFTLSWFTWPQHDYMEKLPLLDTPLSTFFSDLSKDTKLLENTVIILFSDHGSWNAPYSETPDGLIERRLPFLFIRYPKKLQDQQDGDRQLRNLVNNQNRITTHYDTHKTLLHLAQMASSTIATQTSNNNTSGPLLVSTTTKNKKGVSLLSEIQSIRSCQDAHIPTFACACDLLTTGHKVATNEDETDEKSSHYYHLALPSLSKNAYPLNN